MQMVKNTLAASFFILFLLVAGCGTIAQKAATTLYQETASQPIGDRWTTGYLLGDSVRGSNVDLSMEEKRYIG